MTLSEELKWRGFVQDTTLKPIEQLDGEQWTVYIGFDASAPSQTIGNLAAMMAVKVFLRHGCKAIVLAGGATSLIGDAGGRSEERALQDKATIGQNITNAQQQFEIIFKDGSVKYVNNLQWFKDFNVLDFLRDVGKNFSMTPLVQRDYIASRLGKGGSGISYAEFSYTLLQGYDYLRLFEDYGCNLQLGGSDQWGNCLSGVDLIRRKHQRAVHAISLPLIINKATGRKFGKSEAGAVWLDPDLTHPSDFYQFWLNTSDGDAPERLKVFTELKRAEIDDLARAQAENPAQRATQKALAAEVTKLVHGENNLRICELFSRLVFGRNEQKLDKQEFADILSSEPAERKISLAEGAIAEQIIAKIPRIQSRAQIKEMLSNKAFKIVSYAAESGTLAIKIPKDSQELEESLSVTSTQKPLLLVTGKNAVRAVECSTLD